MGEEGAENFSDTRDLLARIRLLSPEEAQQASAWPGTNEEEHRDEEHCTAHVTPF